MHSTLSLLVALFIQAESTGGQSVDLEAARYARSAHIRPLDRICRTLLRRGIEYSPTFRDQIALIDASDIIVYIECGQRLRASVVGVTRLAARAGGYRYLRVSVDERVDGDEAVAILGHELHHVTELARSPHVVDASGVRELYMTLGHRTCDEDPPCFDTAEARRAGDVILQELRRK